MAAKQRQPFDGPIVESPESNALRLVLKLAQARAAIRNARSKPAYLAAATDEWAILSELDGFAAHVAEQEASR